MEGNGKWLDMNGPIMADTVYSDNVLVARDVAFTLPAAVFKTVTMSAMGDMNVPLPGLFDNMELSITKIGVDAGLGNMNKLEKQDLEFRFIQSRITADGTTKQVGCKAFVRTLPVGIPEIGVEVGNTTEVPLTYTVTRMQLYAEGAEILCIDRLARVLRYNGKDYMTSVDSLL